MSAVTHGAGDFLEKPSSEHPLFTCLEDAKIILLNMRGAVCCYAG